MFCYLLKNVYIGLLYPPFIKGLVLGVTSVMHKELALPIDSAPSYLLNRSNIHLTTKPEFVKIS